jgi:hypothetical protein
MATPGIEDHCLTAREAKEQIQEAGIQEQAGVQQLRPTSSVVPAALGRLD